MKWRFVMYTFSFKNGDVLEIKGIKHAAFASQETHCFEASLYLNNKRIGVVSNEGHGGCDRFDPCGNLEDGSYHANNKLYKDACWHMKDEGVWVSKWDGEEHALTMEIWCCDMVNQWLHHKDFKNYIKSKVVYVKPDEKAINYVSFKGVKKVTQRYIDHVKAKYPNYKILNDMPEPEAFDLWMANLA